MRCLHMYYFIQSVCLHVQPIGCSFHPQSLKPDCRPNLTREITVIKSITGWLSSSPFLMPAGLKETEWLGRNQTLSCGPIMYYLDGAHTTASMQACVCWFQQEMLQRGHDQYENADNTAFNSAASKCTLGFGHVNHRMPNIRSFGAFKI